MKCKILKYLGGGSVENNNNNRILNALARPKLVVSDLGRFPDQKMYKTTDKIESFFHRYILSFC